MVSVHTGAVSAATLGGGMMRRWVYIGKRNRNLPRADRIAITAQNHNIHRSAIILTVLASRPPRTSYGQQRLAAVLLQEGGWRVEWFATCTDRCYLISAQDTS